MVEFETIREALRPLDAEYRATYRSIAEEALAAHPDDDEAREEFVRESIDGSEWIIYTYKAQLVLMLTENQDAYTENGGEADGELQWTTLAFYAMREDCMDYLAIIVADAAEKAESAAGAADSLRPSRGTEGEA